MLTGTVAGLIGGGLARQIKIRHGDVGAARAHADVVIEGRYEMGIQAPVFRSKPLLP